MLTRRSLIRSFAALSVANRALRAGAGQTRLRLLVGTGTGGQSQSKGIYAADWNPTTGALGELALAAEIPSPTFLALHPSGRFLYATSETRAGHITAFSVHHSDSTVKLEQLNQQTADGNGPAHVAVNHDGGSAFVANYGGGSLTSYKIDSGGSVSAPVSHFQTDPVDDLPLHAHPHIHESTPSPDGRWLLVNDLGSDRIWIYSLDASTGALQPANPAYWQGRTKSGPRHLVFHPRRRWVYNVNELDSTVDQLAWDPAHGTLTTVGNFVSTLEPDFPRDTAFASEIITSSDGRFVYVGNRRSETIAMLTVDRSSGRLTLAQLLPHGGKTARHITLDPSGRYLLIACQDSGEVVVLGRDAGTGKLSPPLHRTPIASAQCLVFTRG